MSGAPGRNQSGDGVLGDPSDLELPLTIFLSSFPATFLRIMFGTPCSAFPPLSIHSLGTGWVPRPTHQLFLPRSPVSIESSSYVVAFDTTEHLTPPPQPDGFCDGSSSASDTHFSVLLVCSSFCNGWGSSTFHPWPPSLFLSYPLPG